MKKNRQKKFPDLLPRLLTGVLIFVLAAAGLILLTQSLPSSEYTLTVNFFPGDHQ